MAVQGKEIEERKRAEAKLRALTLRYEAILASVPDIIVEMDRNQVYTWANQAGREFFGEDVVGKKAADYFAGEQETDQTDQPLFEGGGEVIYRESWHRRRDGQKRLLAWCCKVLKDAEGKVAWALSTARDITERRWAEEELKRTVVELERSNKELEQLAYVASHDLQAPLRLVAGYTQLLARRYQDRLDAEAHELINFAVDGASRMQRLIDDLLAYSRVNTQGKPPAPTDAQTALEEALANLGAVIEESRAVVTSDQLPPVQADRTQLVQVWQNLVANAIKFHGSEPPRVHIAATARGAEWLFSVKDNGIGIAPAHHERIFAIFQRLHTAAEYPGTGIGLAICQRIVTRHGGKIWVESQLGEGATFYFTFPKREDQ